MLSQLEELFQHVKALALIISPDTATAKDESLKAIFRLNNEIGRLAKSEPASAPAMKRLQAEVNAITVAVKRGRQGEVREAISRAERELRSVAGSTA